MQPVCTAALWIVQTERGCTLRGCGHKEQCWSCSASLEPIVGSADVALHTALDFHFAFLWVLSQALGELYVLTAP